MCESEFFGYNGVIFYFLGVWMVLYFFFKDVGVMVMLLLSWCDMVVSIFGRLYGWYIFCFCCGKFFVGFLVVFFVGVGMVVYFWGWFVLIKGFFLGDENFMFMGIFCFF